MMPSTTSAAPAGPHEDPGVVTLRGAVARAQQQVSVNGQFTVWSRCSGEAGLGDQWAEEDSRHA
jgi:hypothetical protein